MTKVGHDRMNASLGPGAVLASKGMSVTCTWSLLAHNTACLAGEQGLCSTSAAGAMLTAGCAIASMPFNNAAAAACAFASTAVQLRIDGNRVLTQ